MIITLIFGGSEVPMYFFLDKKLDKKKVVTGSALFFLGTASVQAVQLSLNSSKSLHITHAAYLNIPSGVQLASPADLDETVIDLDTRTGFHLDIYSYEPPELLWNGFSLPLPNFDSQWLFLNGLCDQSDNIQVIPKGYCWYLVMPERSCKKKHAPDDLVLTLISITHKPTLQKKTDTKLGYPFYPDDLKSLLNPSLLKAMTTTAVDSISQGFADISLIPDSELRQQKAGQLAALANSNFYASHEVALYVLNTPIPRRNLRYIPGGVEMNEIVENAVSAKALYELIIETMKSRGFIFEGFDSGKKFQEPQGFQEFQDQVQDPDQRINVQSVINYIKELITDNNSDIKKENTPKIVYKAIIDMRSTIPKGGKKQEGPPRRISYVEEPSTRTYVFMSGIPIDLQVLIDDLMRFHQYNATKVVNFLVESFWQIKRLGYGECKRQIRNDDGTINIRGIYGLLLLADGHEKILRRALKPLQQLELDYERSRKRLRSKKPSVEEPFLPKDK